MWAQNFYDSATYFVDGSGDPSRFLPTWEMVYHCWLKSLPLFDPPVEPVSIAYEGTTLHGFYMQGKSKARRRPLLILNNGSDGSLLDMWLWGGAGARARGYDCLTFDGPGQGYALWKQKLYFRPDWEMVIAPVSTLLSRVVISIRNALRFRASAKEDTGFLARLLLRRGLLPQSPILASSMFHLLDRDVAEASTGAIAGGPEDGIRFVPRERAIPCEPRDVEFPNASVWLCFLL